MTDAAPFLMGLVLVMLEIGPSKNPAAVVAAPSEDKVSPVHFHVINYTPNVVS